MSRYLLKAVDTYRVPDEAGVDAYSNSYDAWICLRDYVDEGEYKQRYCTEEDHGHVSFCLCSELSIHLHLGEVSLYEEPYHEYMVDSKERHLKYEVVAGAEVVSQC